MTVQNPAGNAPEGLITALVSPLETNGGPDTAGLAALIKRTAGAGDCVFVNGVYAGEALCLPAETSRAILRAAAEIMGGGGKLMAGVTGAGLEETIANVKFAEDELKRNYSGEIFLVDAPLCYTGNRGLPAHYEMLCGITDLPFILSNQPSAVAGGGALFRRHNIRTGVLKKLSRNIRIMGMEHNGDHARALGYIEAVRNRQDFCFYDADESNFLRCPSTRGAVSAGAAVFPREWRMMVDSSRGEDENRKRDEAELRAVLRTRSMLQEFHDCYGANPPLLLKRALKIAGVIKSDFSPGGEADSRRYRGRVEGFLEKWAGGS